MKNLLAACFLLFALSLVAQSNAEVYLLDITEVDGKMELTDIRNISNNKGYDNQPSFYDNSSILFASTRNGQTDIAKYDIVSGKVTWVNDTPDGGEYSPLRIPNSDNVSAIRLDTTGLQRLYNYNINSGKSTAIRKDAKVGYHVWYSENILVNTILVENRMDLVVSNFKDEINYTVQKNVGRSLHKIPNSELVSFIGKKDGSKSLRSIDPVTGEIKLIAPLPDKTEDICWLADGSFLVPEGNMIYRLNPSRKNGKPAIINLSEFKEIHNISRMAVSPDGKHLALVSEEPPSKIVQKQVDSYNAADLEAFINCYAEDVVVSYYPADVWYEGHKRMREIYDGLSPERKTYEVEVLKRITIGNKVIDHEKVTGGGRIQMQVAIYEVNNGKIESMTFIFDEPEAPNPEEIVQKQLDAYNARDIDGFLATYTEDVELYNFPAEKRSQGQAEMRKNYAEYFEKTPDLNGEIKNRMVIGNKVIDEEYITANGNNFSAVAIYEVENGKISRVTFL